MTLTEIKTALKALLASVEEMERLPLWGAPISIIRLPTDFGFIEDAKQIFFKNRENIVGLLTPDTGRPGAWFPWWRNRHSMAVGFYRYDSCLTLQAAVDAIVVNADLTPQRPDPYTFKWARCRGIFTEEEIRGVVGPIRVGERFMWWQDDLNPTPITVTQEWDREFIRFQLDLAPWHDGVRLTEDEFRAQCVRAR